MPTAKKQAAYLLVATPSDSIKVRGMTLADLLPTFDTVRGTVTDYMQSVCQGVVRLMVDLWVDSKYYDEKYYIGQKIKLVVEHLQLISPPSDMH